MNSILADRLGEMTDDTLEPLLNNDINNSRITLLYIIYKTDKLVRDFILDVYSDKIITRADRITRVDLGKYFEKYAKANQRYSKPQTLRRLRLSLFSPGFLLPPVSWKRLVMTNFALYAQ